MRILALAALAAASLLVGGATASPGDTICTGLLVGGTFDNVVVPENQFCRLQNSVVRGNVKALADSKLVADSNDIRGTVQGDKADEVDVVDSALVPGPSVVGGNIQTKEGGGPTGSHINAYTRICGTELPNGNIQVEKFSRPATGGASEVMIGDDVNCADLGGGNILDKGNIKVEENTITTTMGVDNNTVGGNLQVFKNDGPGPKTVNGNTGAGNLQCFENSPPFNGSGNNFPKKKGQCN